MGWIPRERGGPREVGIEPARSHRVAGNVRHPRVGRRSVGIRDLSEDLIHDVQEVPPRRVMKSVAALLCAWRYHGTGTASGLLELHASQHASPAPRFGSES